MNENESNISTRQAAINGLAIVGFVILVGAGIWLAVYSTRYVPTVVNRMGAAAVYLGSVFTPSSASLSVVPTPTASSTIPSNTASSTTDIPATAEPVASTQTENVTPATTAGQKTSNTVQIGGTAATALSGLPDFAVTANAVGYLTAASADSFVASTTVPAGSRPAVSFTIKNIGTNVSGAWRFSASIPTQTAYIYQSQPQQSLNPGDSIDYTLGFDQANRGVDQMISITANFDRAVAESNSDNNSTSAKITVLGS